ncbi:hypothetical protein BOTBODRAFT_196325 [Botryobasidium botryosum FD-172 SS1]|uniref:Uncharacterized protein n=1 Tax=Botryobasidium botryosum (strain FD-172 SS1) TaxID=930990 RepID=A0A067NBS7_BOTB1|nr:hypothetical protein BOTBODRAFT_196325 [Botryobasidium botryosum FD-172 SS1]
MVHARSRNRTGVTVGGGYRTLAGFNHYPIRLCHTSVFPFPSLSCSQHGGARGPAPRRSQASRWPLAATKHPTSALYFSSSFRLRIPLPALLSSRSKLIYPFPSMDPASPSLTVPVTLKSGPSIRLAPLSESKNALKLVTSTCPLTAAFRNLTAINH